MGVSRNFTARRESSRSSPFPNPSRRPRHRFPAATAAAHPEQHQPKSDRRWLRNDRRRAHHRPWNHGREGRVVDERYIGNCGPGRDLWTRKCESCQLRREWIVARIAENRTVRCINAGIHPGLSVRRSHDSKFRIWVKTELINARVQTAFPRIQNVLNRPIHVGSIVRNVPRDRRRRSHRRRRDRVG